MLVCFGSCGQHVVDGLGLATSYAILEHESQFRPIASTANLENVVRRHPKAPRWLFSMELTSELRFGTVDVSPCRSEERPPRHYWLHGRLTWPQSSTDMANSGIAFNLLSGLPKGSQI